METIQSKKEKKKRETKNQLETSFKMAINTYLSIITLNVNGLNAPIKKHRVADWIKEQKPSTCCLQETYLRAKDTYILKVSGWEKIFLANGQDRRARVAILISDKIDFKMKAIKKDTNEWLKDLFKKRILQLSIYVPLL